MKFRDGLRRRVRWIALFALLLFAVLGVSVYRSVGSAARGRIRLVSDAPSARAAIIFGARVYPDGQLSWPVYLRLQAGLDLYRAGKVTKILVSGDNGRREYNEPEAMKAWLVKQGVPEGDVSCDYAGFRTLDTCARARHVWNLKTALLVTQRYHLPRALYLARAFELDAFGVSADGALGRSPTLHDRLREIPARWLAWCDVHLLQRSPRFYGPRETL